MIKRTQTLIATEARQLDKKTFSMIISEYNELFRYKHICDTICSMAFDYMQKVTNYEFVINIKFLLTNSNETTSNIIKKNNQIIDIHINEYNTLLKIKMIYQQIYNIHWNTKSSPSENECSLIKNSFIVLFNSYMDMKLPYNTENKDRITLLKDPYIINISQKNNSFTGSASTSDIEIHGA